MNKRLKYIFLLTLSLLVSTVALTQTLDSILVDTLNTVDSFEIDSSKVVDSLDVFEEDYSLDSMDFGFDTTQYSLANNDDTLPVDRRMVAGPLFEFGIGKSDW